MARDSILNTRSRVLFVTDGKNHERILRDSIHPINDIEFVSLHPQLTQTAEELHQRICDCDPALVLLDASTIQNLALECTRQLRITTQLQHVPIVVLLSSHHEHEWDLFFDAGADDFLRIPVIRSELLARIRVHLRNRHAFQGLAKREHDANAMLELTQTLASSVDVREILYTVVARIADIVDVERVSVVLAPDLHNTDVGFVAVTSDNENLNNLRIRLSNYPEIQQVLRTQKPLSIPDFSQHPLLDGVREQLKNLPLRSAYLFPIIWKNETIGVLFLRANPHRGPLSDEEMRFCNMLALTTAASLRNARLVQSLRTHSEQEASARWQAEKHIEFLKRYEDVFASSSDGIVVIDHQGHIRFANPRTFEVMGQNMQALASRTWLSLIHPDDQSHAQTILDGFARANYPRNIDLNWVAASGKVVICECSFAPLNDHHEAILVSFRDVTLHRHIAGELVKTKDFLASIIHTSVDAIVATNQQGKITLFNEGAEAIFGHSSAEACEQLRFADLCDVKEQHRLLRMLMAQGHGGRGRLASVATQVKHRDGSKIPVSLSATILRGQQQVRTIVGVFHDLRKMVQTQQRLEVAQHKLARSEKQILLAELAGTAAHELNQPLTSVMGSAALLRRHLEEDASKKHIIDMLVEEIERMADIVRKIGQITRYETKSYVGEQRILDLDKAIPSDVPQSIP